VCARARAGGRTGAQDERRAHGRVADVGGGAARDGEGVGAVVVVAAGEGVVRVPHPLVRVCRIGRSEIDESFAQILQSLDVEKQIKDFDKEVNSTEIQIQMKLQEKNRLEAQTNKKSNLQEKIEKSFEQFKERFLNRLNGENDENN
jgi:hypothetical protein